jgi:hypothetical protein
VENAGGHDRNPNGILCLVEYAGVTGPTYTFDLYDVAPDRDNREFNNKVEQVKQEI